jgi:UDP-2,3-diacylglucosamine pyrophosphatase LpxH
MRFFLSKKHKPFNGKVRALSEDTARRSSRKGYDAVIVAHSHIPDIETHDMNGATRTYLNTGDLVMSGSYGEYTTGGGFAIRTYGADVP